MGGGVGGWGFSLGLWVLGSLFWVLGSLFWVLVFRALGGFGWRGLGL